MQTLLSLKQRRLNTGVFFVILKYTLIGYDHR